MAIYDLDLENMKIKKGKIYTTFYPKENNSNYFEIKIILDLSSIRDEIKDGIVFAEYYKASKNFRVIYKAPIQKLKIRNKKYLPELKDKKYFEFLIPEMYFEILKKDDKIKFNLYQKHSKFAYSCNFWSPSIYELFINQTFFQFNFCTGNALDYISYSTFENALKNIKKIYNTLLTSSYNNDLSYHIKQEVIDNLYSELDWLPDNLENIQLFEVMCSLLEKSQNEYNIKTENDFHKWEKEFTEKY